MQSPDVQQAKRVLIIQIVMTLGLAGSGLAFGRMVGMSVLIGAGAATLANILFALWVFGRYRAQEPSILLLRFYGAEIAKIFLVLAMFVAAFALVEGLNVPALLGAYFAIQVFPALFSSGVSAR
jgi:ATP synthase protein I